MPMRCRVFAALLLATARTAALAARPATRAASPLAGTVHACRLDFGRETGTWMPPRWASYGRTEFAVDLRYEADGSVAVVDGPRPLRGLALGTGATWTVTGGAWTVDGPTLRVRLAHDGLAVADCVLDAGDLDLAIPIFPNGLVSAKEGLMSIVAYRFVVRKERRLVGVWFATPEAPPAGS